MLKTPSPLRSAGWKPWGRRRRAEAPSSPVGFCSNHLATTKAASQAPGTRDFQNRPLRLGRVPQVKGALVLRRSAPRMLHSRGKALRNLRVRCRAWGFTAPSALHLWTVGSPFPGFALAVQFFATGSAGPSIVCFALCQPPRPDVGAPLVLSYSHQPCLRATPPKHRGLTRNTGPRKPLPPSILRTE